MKHINKFKSFIALALLAVAFASCHKDQNAPAPVPGSQRIGIYILNQGNFTHNNSTLTYFSFTTQILTADEYVTVNTTKLGDVGNDAEIYGSKMFIVVNNSNVIDVVGAKSCKLIKQITLNQPRSVVFFGSNAFVTSYSGTVSVIDTAALTINKTITVGPDPEQMVVSNNKIYVANSGGLNATFNNTVSVIDPVGLTVTKTITIPIVNPFSMTADNYGHVYVGCVGDYNTVLPGVVEINNASDAVVTSPTLNLGYSSPIVNNGDYIYYFTMNNTVGVFNAKTQANAQANFVSDGTTFTAPYAITIDNNTGETFITDALNYSSNGTMYAFDATGKKEYTLTVGINPGKVVLVNQ